MIATLSAREVLDLSRRAFGLPTALESPVDDAFLAESIRRAAGMLCPCSPATLVAAVVESLQGLTDGARLRERVQAITDDLVVWGDLLEQDQASIDDPNVKGTWVVAAPPSFVERPGGSVVLLGLAPDDAIPLPDPLRSQVRHEGLARTLAVSAADLPTVLRGLGLIQLSSEAWLRAPKPEPASGLRDRVIARLSAQPPSGDIPDLSIIDSTRAAHDYAGRWRNPTNQSGAHVARRPQAHGAPLWGVVALKQGRPEQFLDLPLPGRRWRGCDAAWHLQMALDHLRGAPQTYRLRHTAIGPCLDFWSPLPLWAERRLAILGRPAPRDRCLFSYCLPESELATERAFLQDRLWLAHGDVTGEPNR